MSKNAVATITMGVMGSGKTFGVVDRIVREYLPLGEGVIYSNLPLYTGQIARYVAKRHKMDKKELHARLQVIPRKVLDSWRRGETGPWDYFNGKETEGALIVIDECDAFVGVNAPEKTKSAWRDWISELRKSGARIEFLVQHFDNVYSGIHRFVEIRRTVTKCDTLRDPWFGVTMGDWYELRGKLSGEYGCRCIEKEERRSGNKWEKTQVRTFVLAKFLFGFYNSYNDAVKTTLKGAKAPKYEFQKKSAPQLFKWFLRKNWLHFATRFVLVGVFCWIFFFGGMTLFLRGTMEYMGMAVRSNSGVAAGVGPDSSPTESALPAKEHIGMNNEAGTTDPSEILTVARVEPVDLVIHKIPDEMLSKASQAVEVEEGEDIEDRILSVMESEVKGLMERVVELELERDKLQQKVEELLPPTYIVMMTNEYALFSDGKKYKEREKLGRGPYEGRYIEKINFDEREVVLIGGDVLRPGMPGHTKQKNGLIPGI